MRHFALIAVLLAPASSVRAQGVKSELMDENVSDFGTISDPEIRARIANSINAWHRQQKRKPNYLDAVAGMLRKGETMEQCRKRLVSQLKKRRRQTTIEKDFDAEEEKAGESAPSADEGSVAPPAVELDLNSFFRPDTEIFLDDNAVRAGLKEALKNVPVANTAVTGLWIRSSTVNIPVNNEARRKANLKEVGTNLELSKLRAAAVKKIVVEYLKQAGFAGPLAEDIHEQPGGQNNDGTSGPKYDAKDTATDWPSFRYALVSLDFETKAPVEPPAPELKVLGNDRIYPVVAFARFTHPGGGGREGHEFKQKKYILQSRMPCTKKKR